PYVGGKTTLGRETFLTPIEWKDGWPVAVDKKAFIEVEAPSGAEQNRNKILEFDFADPKWEADWLFVRSRNEECIKRENGKLIMRASDTKLTDKQGVPSFVAVRQPDFECSVETELDFDPQQDGDEAGLAAYLTPCNVYRICKKCENGKNYIVIVKRADDFVQETYRTEVPDGRLKFKINSDREKYEFMYSVNDSEYISAGEASAKFLTTEVADRCFTGTVIGVYTQAEKETSAETVVYSYKSVCQGI
ncbi:MAG: hypothetical protein IJX57_04650, partial [Clostridia bacterium]|nr:hypothetical protein [Clostridia bacterium]